MDYPQNPIDPYLSLPQNSIEALDLLKASDSDHLSFRPPLKLQTIVRCFRPSFAGSGILISPKPLPLTKFLIDMRRFDHSTQYPFRLSLQILRHGTTTTTTTKILLAIQQTRLFPSTLLPKPLHNDAGPTIVLSYATSGLSALLSVFCYTEFAVEIPESDADFLRIRVNSLAEGFNLLDPIVVVVLAIDNTIAMSGTHRTSCLNWVASIFSAGAPDCETLFQNLLDHVNANGEQMPIASSSMIRSHSVSGDLHGVQLDPVAADILRKELEHETFVQLKISPTSILHLLALSMQSNYLRIASYQKCSICILQIKHVYQDANSIAEFLASYVVLYGRNSDFSENGKLPTTGRVLLQQDQGMMPSIRLKKMSVLLGVLG
ncbi:unnamed protein product, partial [Ilex paraguariensis]